MHVAAHDRVHPDAALLADVDVADHLRAVVDEGGGMDARTDPAVRPKHCWIIPAAPAATPGWRAEPMPCEAEARCQRQFAPEVGPRGQWKKMTEPYESGDWLIAAELERRGGSPAGSLGRTRAADTRPAPRRRGAPAPTSSRDRAGRRPAPRPVPVRVETPRPRDRAVLARRAARRSPRARPDCAVAARSPSRGRPRPRRTSVP